MIARSRFRTSLLFAAVLALLAAGCAVSGQRRGGPSPPQKPTAAEHCPDRVERARAAGAAGSFLGIIMSLAGSPILGGFYQVAGYVIGFSSSDACKEASPQKGERPLEAATEQQPLTDEY